MYKNILLRFISSNYYLPAKYYSRYNQPELKTFISNSIQSKLEKGVKWAYQVLINTKKYGDALIIQLIYSFSLDVDTLCLLKFSNVDRERFISYENLKTRKQKKILQDNKTIEFILFLIEYKGSKDKYFIITNRKLEKEDIEEGIFIISVTYSKVYKKFHNRFNGILDWFYSPPKRILKLNFNKVYNNGKVKGSS